MAGQSQTLVSMACVREVGAIMTKMVKSKAIEDNMKAYILRHFLIYVTIKLDEFTLKTTGHITSL